MARTPPPLTDMARTPPSLPLFVVYMCVLQHTHSATLCSTLRRTIAQTQTWLKHRRPLRLTLAPICRLYMCSSAHCNALQYTAIHCNRLHQTATHCNIGLRDAVMAEISLPLPLHPCSYLSYVCVFFSTLPHSATQCNTLHHSATHCNTL